MQERTTQHQHIAEELADLLIESSEERDRNGLLGEAEKAFHYLRAARDAEQLMALLALRADRNQPFAQTRNIPFYYHQLFTCVSAVRRTHPDLSTEDLAAILGWAVRIARYRHHVGATPVGGRRITIAEADRRLPPRPRRQPVATPPKGPTIPEVGQKFYGKIKQLDDEAALIEVPPFSVDKVVAVLKADQMGGKRFRVDNTTHLEVISRRTLKSGRVILEVKLATAPTKATNA